MSIRGDCLKLITDFLTQIEIDWEYTELNKDTFLAGTSISKGRLQIDKSKLKLPGDLLHEAGHIAIEPAKTRSNLQENVRESGQGDGEEIAAIAWSYAASVAIGLPPEVVFHEQGYRGASQSIIRCFQEGGYYGQPLLSFYGMCKPLGEPDGFPKMEKWLRT